MLLEYHVKLVANVGTILFEYSPLGGIRWHESAELKNIIYYITHFCIHFLRENFK